MQASRFMLGFRVTVTLPQAGLKLEDVQSHEVVVGDSGIDGF